MTIEVDINSSIRQAVARAEAAADAAEAANAGLAVYATLYGATPDNSTDNYAAITTALATGKNVILPPGGTYRIETQLSLASNQTLIIQSGAVLRQMTANAVAVDMSGVTNAGVVGGGQITACGTLSSYVNGNGVRIRNGSDGCFVENVRISNHRGWAVLIQDSSYCRVYKNTTLNSPVTDSDPSANVTGDIGVIGNSKFNIVEGNSIRSGNGIGVSIQTLVGSDGANDNCVSNNNIQNSRIYGVLLYITDPASNALRNAVLANHVTNITGATQSTATGTYDFGAGIYIQGAEDTRASFNQINGTHTAARAFTETLAPGAIGAIDVTRFDISNNTIADARQHGVMTAYALAGGSATGYGQISNNEMTSVVKHALYVKERGNIRLSGNTADGVGQRFINIQNTVTKRPDIFVEGNKGKNITGIGLFANYVKNATFNDNKVETNANYPVTVDYCDDFDLSRNQVVTACSIAIVVDTHCNRFTYNENRVTGILTNPGNAIQVTTAHSVDSRPSSTPLGNSAVNATNRWGGVYAAERATVPVSGSWVQGDVSLNSAPAAGGNIGWVCTTGGAPGTWKTYGAIAA